MKHRQVRIKGTGVVNSDGHTIGVDIGATAVRASVLTQGMLDGQAGVTAHGLGTVPLEPGVVVNGVVQEPAAVTAALKRLWQANKFECRNIVLGIANPQVLVRDITIPDLDPVRRAKALPFQARDVVALPVEEVVLDFCQLGEPDPETATVNGLLLAVPRGPVWTAVAAAERANLHVARVDLSAFGVLRSIGSEHQAAEAIVDIGAHLTTIVIHRGGVPKLVRTLMRGGDQVTNEVADRLGIAVAEVEQRKKEYGLHGVQLDFTRALTDALRPLIGEIRTSIQYFRTAHDGAGLDRMSMTGGGGALDGLNELLSDQLGVPVRHVDPMQHVRNRHSSRQMRDGDAPQAASAVAIGLAMGAAA